MAVGVGTYNVDFRAYCDEEAYNGFNLALCLYGDTPLTNPIQQVYIKPPWEATGLYHYSFKEWLLDTEKTYNVFVQVVSYGKDSEWVGIGGFTCPDDGVATVGGSVTLEELQKIINETDLDGGNIAVIDGNVTQLVNIPGSAIVAGSITAGSINVNDLVVNGLATFNGNAWVKGSMIVQGDLRINGDQIVDGDTWLNGKLTVLGPTIFKDFVTFEELAVFEKNVHIYGDQIVDGSSWINKSLTVVGPTVLKDSLTVLGPTFLQDLITNGDAWIHGNQIVDGEQWIHGNSIIDGNQWIKGNLEVDGGAMLKGALEVTGATHLKEFLTADAGAWIDGVQIKDNAVTADKVVVNGELTAKLATVEEAWIGGVHIKDNSITAGNISADSINAQHLQAGSVTAGSISANSVHADHISSEEIKTRHLAADIIQAKNIAVDAVEAKHIKISGELSAKLATLNEAWIGGVHIKDNEIEARKINTLDLVTNGLATVNVAYITETNIEYASIKNSHLQEACVDHINIKDGIIDIAKISDYLQSTNFETGVSGWRIEKSGLAEFCNGAKIANWIVEPNRLKSSATGARIDLIADKNRVAIIGSDNLTKVAMGYWDGLQKFDENGQLLDGQFWSSSDYGHYIAPGNKLSILGNVEFSHGTNVQKSDGSYNVVNALNDVVIKMGTESGETGFFCYDEFGNIISALTNNRIEIGDIASATGMKYDSNGLQIVGAIKITAPVDTSGISVPNPSNIGVVLL